MARKNCLSIQPYFIPWHYKRHEEAIEKLNSLFTSLDAAVGPVAQLECNDDFLWLQNHKLSKKKTLELYKIWKTSGLNYMRACIEQS